MTSEDDLLAVIGGLYDAALDAACWPQALRSVADALDSRAALVFLYDKAQGANLFSVFDGLDPDSVAEFDRELAAQDPRMQFAMGNSSWTELYDYMTHSESEMDRDAHYAWMARYGFRYYLAVPLVNDAHNLGLATVQRLKTEGHVSRQEVALLHTLAAHIRRVVQLNRRIGEAGSSGNVLGDALEASALGAILLDQGGAVLFANREARRLADTGAFRLGPAGLSAARPADDLRLQRLIGGAVATARGLAGSAGGAMSLVRPQGRPLQFLVAPLPARSERFALLRPAAVAFVSDPDRTPEPTAATLCRLWGLTTAEARLAAELAGGLGLREAAKRLGIAEPTARTHLAAIFRKTGARRQAELARLLPTLPDTTSR